MSKLSRNSLLAAASALAMLSAPLAFAQSTDAAATQQTDVSAQAAGTQADVGTSTATDAQSTGVQTATDATMDTGTETATDATANAGTETAADATADAGVNANADAGANATANAGGQKSWADIDTDKDGNISKTEAVGMPALDRVFADADGNADGSLTADEYRDYAAKAGAQSNTEAGAKDETATDESK